MVFIIGIFEKTLTYSIISKENILFRTYSIDFIKKIVIN